MKLNYGKIKSPVGTLHILAEGSKIFAVMFNNTWKPFQRDLIKKDSAEIKKLDTPVIKKTKKQLTEYFAGKRQKFKIPMKLKGTKFQTSVWNSLAKIPFGETRSYKDQARIIKSPKAARAIGRADGLNPICIILPCHRVIGSDGSLTGFAGGLKVKKQLLELEAGNI